MTFDPAEARDQDGRWTDSGGGDSAARAARARSTYKPSTAAKQRAAEANESELVGMIGGKQSGDNAPADVTMKIGGKMHGIEVKTLLDNSNDKITMHPPSLARKKAWAERESATLHTVVFDNRTRARGLYYRRGVGSFRVSSMTPVASAAHLRRLMAE